MPVDLGIVYSGFQIELMKNTLPGICRVSMLQQEAMVGESISWARVVDVAADGGREKVLEQALRLAKTLVPRAAAQLRALGPIKRKLHAKALAVLEEGSGSDAMGFSGRREGDNYAPPRIPRL